MMDLKSFFHKKYWTCKVQYIMWKAYHGISLPKADTSDIPDLSELSDEEIEQMLSA